MAALGADFRCVLLTLPNYGERAVRPGGFDFPELVDRIAATVRKVQPDGQVGLVTHDWGAYLGYLLEEAHPGSVRRIAALDIGGHLGAPGLRSALMIVGYQRSLIAAWVVGGVIPPLAAIASAVGKAIGARITDLPCSPPHVLPR